MIKKVALVSACDRNNYGDVLMPVVFKQYLRKTHVSDKFCLETFALTASENMKLIGGNATRPVYEITNHDAVIFLGGEIMCADYVEMYSHMNRFALAAKKFMNRFHFHKLRKLANIYLQHMIFHEASSLPWMYMPKHEHQKVYYNCIGGVGYEYLSDTLKEDWGKVSKSSRFFSVRDRKTYEALSQTKEFEDCTLVPCTVMIASELFDDSFIKSKLSEEFKNLTGIKYYVLQVNFKIGKHSKQIISEAINNIYQKYHLKCLLLPIGRASGHDDQIILQDIHKRTLHASVYVRNNSLFDTMFIISNAVCYVGTSLHGAITAMSYYVPHAAFSTHSHKLINYIDTWNTSEIEYVNNAEEIEAFVHDSIYSGSSVHIGKIEEAKIKVWNYLDALKNDLLME